MKAKENKGITLVALIVTIIVLLIIAGIAVYNGKETIQKANLESLRTNMLLIEAKAKGLVEEANFQLGPNFKNESQENQATKLAEVRQSIYDDENKLGNSTSISGVPSGVPTGDNVYVFTSETAALWGLDNVYGELESGENYLIEFDEENATVEIYNTIGYQGHYSLTEIDELQ